MALCTNISQVFKITHDHLYTKGVGREPRFPGFCTGIEKIANKTGKRKGYFLLWIIYISDKKNNMG